MEVGNFSPQKDPSPIPHSAFGRVPSSKRGKKWRNASVGKATAKSGRPTDRPPTPKSSDAALWLDWFARLALEKLTGEEEVEEGPSSY